MSTSVFRNKMLVLDEILQNLPYFCNYENQLFLFCFSFHATFFHQICQHILGHSLGKGKNKVAQNEEKEKGFSYSKNMTNYEAFRSNITSSINLLF